MCLCVCGGGEGGKGGTTIMMLQYNECNCLRFHQRKQKTSIAWTKKISNQR